jgi:hypothetical protein
MDVKESQFNTKRQELADFWKHVAGNPEAFLTGPVERGVMSAEDIARQISTDIDCVQGASFGDTQAVFLTLEGVLSVFPANENRNSEGGFADFCTRLHAAPSIKPGQDHALLHDAALSWIYANGGAWAADSSSPGLDGLLATSIMLSSTLREQSTGHLQPAPHQKIIHWRDGEFDNNVAALAERESELVHERIPELVDYAFDAGRGRVVAADGREVQPDEIRQILARRDPQRTTGVGEATFARALATRAALCGESSFGNDRGVAVRQAAELFGETTPL